jgi:uncharacterized protein
MSARYRIVIACVVAVVIAMAGLIALRSYRAALAGLFQVDPPSPLLRRPADTGIAGLTNVSFTMAGGLKLGAWYAPSRNGAAVLVTHGTNSDRSTMLPELRVLADAGYGVLAFDWPGLGESQGQVRWDGQARSALVAALDWLSAQPGVDPTRIGGLGFSIGAFVMAQVAASDQRLRAVVLEAPPPDFRDYTRINRSRWGILSQWSALWALRGTGILDPDFAPVRLVHRISPRPLLLLVGSQDTEVPTVLVTKVFNAAGEPKALWVVPGASHGGYVQAGASEYTRRIAAFFADGLSPAHH